MEQKEQSTMERKEHRKMRLSSRTRHLRFILLSLACACIELTFINPRNDSSRFLMILQDIKLTYYFGIPGCGEATRLWSRHWKRQVHR
jgi:hypothetical protein